MGNHIGRIEGEIEGVKQEFIARIEGLRDLQNERHKSTMEAQRIMNENINSLRKHIQDEFKEMRNAVVENRVRVGLIIGVSASIGSGLVFVGVQLLTNAMA